MPVTPVCDLAMNFSGPTTFIQNVALEQGGAVSASGAGVESEISGATFRQNVAAFGGALFLEDCLIFTYVSNNDVDFAENIALDGGAVYLDSRHGVLEAYLVCLAVRKHTCSAGFHNV